MKTEIVDLKDVNVTSERGSMYSDAIRQVLELETGKGLKITNPSNTHLRNTLFQLMARKGLKDQIRIVVANKEVYIVKK